MTPLFLAVCTYISVTFAQQKGLNYCHPERSLSLSCKEAIMDAIVNGARTKLTIALMIVTVKNRELTFSSCCARTSFKFQINQRAEAIRQYLGGTVGTMTY